MAKLQLRTNVPEVIALQFAQGKEVPSEYAAGGVEVCYTLADGRVWYVHPAVARKVDALSLGKGEPFEVTKCEVPGGKGFTYEVKHFVPTNGTMPFGAALAKQLATIPSTVPIVSANRNGTPPEVGPLQNHSTTSSKLMSCFMAAVDSLVEVEAYAKRKGMAVTFNAEDVRATANTLFIAESRGGR